VVEDETLRMTSSRDKILGCIRAALSQSRCASPRAPDHHHGQAQPAEDEAARPPTSPAVATERFLREARAVGAQTYTACDVAGCARLVENYLAQCGVADVIVHDEPLARAVVAHVTQAAWRRACNQPPGLPGGPVCSLLAATAALADTGSVIVVTRSAADRVAPYAAPVCIVVVPASRVWAGLDAQALAGLEAAAREPGGGEAVIITGPSRTADIEKTLVIGAHGPRQLAIMVIERPPDATGGDAG
jgi:L-lactate dehydrogenase complex protein LldG